MADNTANRLDPFQQEILENLIKIKTVYPPGNEAAAAEYLRGVLEPLGFTTELQPIQPGRANLIARLHGGPGPEIALNGHLDVVAADAEQWRHDPFSLRQDGDALYGRGVCDMKGAVSCMVAASRDLILSGGSFDGTLTLVFVMDEEINALGSRRYVAALPADSRPAAVIIGEPTMMNIFTAHRGVIRYHVEVTGKSGHAARPNEAVNPITIAGKLAQLIEDRNAELAKQTHPVLPSPSIALTMIAGGEQPNTIPGACKLTIDRRTMPGEGEEELRREFAGLRGKMPADQAGRIGDPQFFVDIRASEQLPGSTLSQDCGRILRAMGIDAQTSFFPAGCDQFVFIEAGIDCLLIGPGDIAQGHTVDEFIAVEQLKLAREFYRRFLADKLNWRS
ncbi:MAG: M20 family metallopeptidase [Planctomycetes bacterium]|nr:M20 family metallopeptidase [Planctomycetota bacterium]